MLAAVAITTLLAVASASEVWPMPVNFTQGSTPVALSPADFTFQCTGLCPPVVSAAFIRYQDLVFVGTISKKRWTVTQKSADMPVLLGINFTVAGSVPVDFAVDESYTLQVRCSSAASRFQPHIVMLSLFWELHEGCCCGGRRVPSGGCCRACPEPTTLATCFWT
jgi:hypothetical protein